MQHPSAFLTLVNEVKSHIDEVSIEEAKNLIADHDDITIIDVREDSEFAQGHIPNALHLSKGMIELKIADAVPDTNKTILLYCGGGYRSALAAYNIQKMGYQHVISMDCGFRGWVNAGLPVAQ